jgi:hypothetical protein
MTATPFTAIAMVPPHLVEKCAREAQPQSHQPVRDSGNMEWKNPGKFRSRLIQHWLHILMMRCAPKPDR